MIKAGSVDNHLKAFVLFLDSACLVCLAIDYWVNIKSISGMYSEHIINLVHNFSIVFVLF